jgi:hypothetical protein
MPKFLLTKNGKFASKNGKLVVVEDPADCDCCGQPPVTCDRVAEIKVEWGGMSLARTFDPAVNPNGFACDGNFDACNVGGEGMLPQSVQFYLCTYKDTAWNGVPVNRAMTARITNRSYAGERANFPRCNSFANTKDRIQGSFFIEIFPSAPSNTIFNDWWRQYYTVDAELKEGEANAVLAGDKPQFKPSDFGPDCGAAMQDFWNKPPKVTVTLKARRVSLPPPENPFP